MMAFVAVAVSAAVVVVLRWAAWRLRLRRVGNKYWPKRKDPR